MKKRGKGGVILGPSRVFSLAYADDMILMADEERGMRLMLNEFEKYVSEKDLCINVEKTKVMRFRKRRKIGKEEWKLNGSEVEEVNEFCYLGYWLQFNGKQNLNVERRIEKAGKIIGKVWGIGIRRFKNDWRRRVDV